MGLGDQLTLGWFLTASAIIAAVVGCVFLFLGRRSEAAWKREADWSDAFAEVARDERAIVTASREFDHFMVLLLEQHQHLLPPVAGTSLASAWEKTRGGLIELLDAVENNWDTPTVRKSLERAGLTGEVGKTKAAILINRVRKATTIMQASDGTLGKRRKRKVAAGAAKAGNVVIKSLIAAANATVVLAPLALPAHAATEVKDFTEVLLEHGGD